MKQGSQMLYWIFNFTWSLNQSLLLTFHRVRRSINRLSVGPLSLPVISIPNTAHYKITSLPLKSDCNKNNHLRGHFLLLRPQPQSNHLRLGLRQQKPPPRWLFLNPKTTSKHAARLLLCFANCTSLPINPQKIQLPVKNNQLSSPQCFLYLLVAWQNITFTFIFTSQRQSNYYLVQSKRTHRFLCRSEQSKIPT